METSSPQNAASEHPVDRAARIVEGRQVLADRIGVSVAAIGNWKLRGVPIEQCWPIERATGGAVTRKDLRPDDWQEIWPELAEGVGALLQSGLDKADAALQVNPNDRTASLVKRNRTQALTELAATTETAAAGG